MGQLRTTVQTLAGLDLAPQRCCTTWTSRPSGSPGPEWRPACTRSRPDRAPAGVANAGHPPPILLHADGLAEVLRVPPARRSAWAECRSRRWSCPPRPGRPCCSTPTAWWSRAAGTWWGGIELLRERLHDAAAVLLPPPLEPLCDEGAGDPGPGDRDDDIALLAARFDGISPSDVAYWFLEPQAQTPPGPRLVRRRCTAGTWTTRWTRPELLVSEIVTNAVRYAERPVTLRLAAHRCAALRGRRRRAAAAADCGTPPRRRRRPRAVPGQPDGQALGCDPLGAGRWSGSSCPSGSSPGAGRCRLRPGGSGQGGRGQGGVRCVGRAGWARGRRAGSLRIVFTPSPGVPTVGSVRECG